jgi:uncharacterized protein (DUF362 family)
MDRRKFMKTIGTAGTAVLLNPMDILLRRAMASPRYFGLHPFIEAHPEAVFIKRTHVSIKTDAEANKEEGVALAREIFVPKDTPGFPFSNRIVVKPNLTEGGRGDVESMGIITDPYFVEGVIEGMKELGLRGDQFSLIEINGPHQWSVKGYTQMAQRTGVHLRDLTRDVKTLEEGTEVTWVDCPDGVMFKRIAYLAPVNQPDTWLLNIPKFKAHGMGLTLCCKNQQGMCAQTYVNFCGNVNRVQGYPSHVFADFQPDFRPGGHGGTGGFWMETWAQRTCDSLSVTDTGFCIVEGVYGRDGNGFMNGPGPGGTAQDYMTNVLIFGKDKFRVDIVGHWLGGHEPGNFGLFHIARERGLSNVLNPAEIPVYRWEEGMPTLAPLTDFERFPLKTYYLQRDYAGQNELKYHLVDEPFDYGPFTSVAATHEAKPGAYVLGQNFPNPFNASTIIEYRMPRDGYVSLEVYNSMGQRIEVLVDGWRTRGAHMASWNARKRASGAYFYRFRTDGFEETRKMVLIR